MAKRPPSPRFTSPKGFFKYPKVSEADYGSKEFPKKDGEYSVTLVVKAADPAVQDFIGKLQPYYERALAAADIAFTTLKAESRKKLGAVKPNPLYTELLDEATEQPTGELSFKFSVPAMIRQKVNGELTGKIWDNRPAVFGASTEKLIEGFNFRERTADDTVDALHGKRSPNIWGGTVGKVSFEIKPNKDETFGYFIPGTGAAGLKMTLRAVQVIDLVSGGQRTAADEGFGDEGPADREQGDPGPQDADF